MWRILVLLWCRSPPGARIRPGIQPGYQSKELAEAAAAYRQELLDSVPADQRQPALIARLRRDADEEYRAKRYAQAIDDLTRAIAFGADDGLVWLRLAQNMAAASDDHVTASAYNAYLKSTDPVERGDGAVSDRPRLRSPRQAEGSAGRLRGGARPDAIGRVPPRGSSS